MTRAFGTFLFAGVHALMMMALLLAVDCPDWLALVLAGAYAALWVKVWGETLDDDAAWAKWMKACTGNCRKGRAQKEQAD
jgi:hypothetical protein